MIYVALASVFAAMSAATEAPESAAAAPPQHRDAAQGQASNSVVTETETVALPAISLRTGTKGGGAHAVDLGGGAKTYCGTDHIVEYNATAAMAGKSVVTVAVASYGLFRNNCSAYTYKHIFAPLSSSTRYAYAVDHFLHSNELFAGYEAGNVRSKLPSPPVSLNTYMDYPACRSAATPQEVVDMEIQPYLAATCGTYGDAWGDLNCNTTRNYLRALASQKRVRTMILAHERTAKLKYDIVVLMRPDVLFTRPLDVKYFDAIARGLFRRPQVLTMFTPNWAMWSGANDRFLLGARDGVLHAMQRLEYAVHWCDNVRQGPLHSERFLFWVLNNYTRWISAGPTNQRTVEVHAVHDFFFRRLRVSSRLMHADYLNNCGTWLKPHLKEACPNETSRKTRADEIPWCSRREVEAMVQEWNKRNRLTPRRRPHQRDLCWTWPRC